MPRPSPLGARAQRSQGGGTRLAPPTLNLLSWLPARAQQPPQQPVRGAGVPPAQTGSSHVTGTCARGSAVPGWPLSGCPTTAPRGAPGAPLPEYPVP